jgi:hypothetical protein
MQRLRKWIPSRVADEVIQWHGEETQLWITGGGMVVKFYGSSYFRIPYAEILDVTLLEKLTGKERKWIKKQ